MPVLSDLPPSVAELLSGESFSPDTLEIFGADEFFLPQSKVPKHGYLIRCDTAPLVHLVDERVGADERFACMGGPRFFGLRTTVCFRLADDCVMRLELAHLGDSSKFRLLILIPDDFCTDTLECLYQDLAAASAFWVIDGCAQALSDCSRSVGLSAVVDRVISETSDYLDRGRDTRRIGDTEHDRVVAHGRWVDSGWNVSPSNVFVLSPDGVDEGATETELLEQVPSIAPAREPRNIHWVALPRHAAGGRLIDEYGAIEPMGSG